MEQEIISWWKCRLPVPHSWYITVLHFICSIYFHPYTHPYRHKQNQQPSFTSNNYLSFYGWGKNPKAHINLPFSIANFQIAKKWPEKNVLITSNFWWEITVTEEFQIKVSHSPDWVQYMWRHLKDCKFRIYKSSTKKHGKINFREKKTEYKSSTRKSHIEQSNRNIFWQITCHFHKSKFEDVLKIS